MGMKTLIELEAEVAMLRNAWDLLNREMENNERVQTARKGHLDALKYARKLAEENKRLKKKLVDNHINID
jgi:hypothetical protein